MANDSNEGIKDLFGKLKSQIVGTKTSNIDTKLDSAVKDITSYRSHRSQLNHIETIRNLISKTQSGLNGQAGLFAQHGDTTPASMGQGMRLKRYQLYDSIVSNITYCRRALNVLVENILSPDDISKISLEITPESYLEDKVDTESRIQKIRDIVRQIKLEENLDLIFKNSLLYGDFFCEIADNKSALTSKSFLVESELLTKPEARNKSIVYNTDDVKVTINYESLFEKGGQKAKDKQDDNYKISELNLVLHDPNRVVKLQSDLYPLCFGYLVFPRHSGYGAAGSYYQQQPINDICSSILKDLQKNIPQAEELKNDEELKNIISSMVQSSGRSQIMNIRYVPPNRVTHFMLPSTKFYPYGESIFDPVQFDCKVLMAMQTALAVQRLNKSTEKRKIGIELGLPRDASNQIQELKETFRKRKVNLDSFGTIDSIPCLDLNTKIRLLDGFSLPLHEIINKFNDGYDLWVYSYNFDTGKIIPNKIKNAKITGRNVQVIKVKLDNGEVVKCTPEHRWLMRDGTYKEAKDLEENDSLMPFYRKTSRSNSFYDIKCSMKSPNNHKVISIEYCDEKIDVGDIEVDKYNNFALDSGIFIHNSSINTFEDIYIPQKDGKPYVDIENIDAGTVDTRSKVDELKFLRDSIITALNVPPAFLGSEENLSQRSTLSEENALFARTIVGYQKPLSQQIRDLIYKVYYLVDPENALTIFENVNVSLPSPKNMQFERISKAMSDSVNLIESLERIGVPKDWAKKKFLTNIDWEEVENYEVDEKIDEKLGTKEEGEEGEEGGGGFGF